MRNTPHKHFSVFVPAHCAGLTAAAGQVPHLLQSAIVPSGAPRPWDSPAALMSLGPGSLCSSPLHACQQPLACADWGGSGSFLVLSTLLLHNNALQGTLPETWGTNLNNVTSLDLTQNLLTGTLPAGEHPAEQLHPWSMWLQPRNQEPGADLMC